MDSDPEVLSDSENGGTAKELKPTSKQSIARALLEDVDVRFAYLPLLTCCYISGLTDATIYNAYGTFVSMQTGNTIFVALGTSSQNGNAYDLARSLISIVFFVIGSFGFSRFYQLLGGKRRGTLILSFVLQAVFVIVATVIVQSSVVDDSHSHSRPAPKVTVKELTIIALLSFQAAGQIVSSRRLGIPEVPTVVVTSMLCDLVSDPALFATTGNHKRSRRFIAFALTLVGGICGGYISKETGAVAPSLWTVGGLKLLIAMAWVFWKGDEKQVVA